MTPSTLTRILTLRVDLRDEAACAEISPEMAEKYLRAKGWTRVGSVVTLIIWQRYPFEVDVPARSDFPDYGRRMVELLGVLAAAEKRSPLAVWVDMMAQKETA